MEIDPKPRDAAITRSSSNYSSTNGGAPAAKPPPSSPTALPPLTPQPIPRACVANPCPTTFVHADASSFKQVVQMLTGSAETAAANSTAERSSVAPAAKVTGPKKAAFKLYERRSRVKNLKMIGPLIPTLLDSNPNSPVGGAAFSPRKLPEVPSPSTLDFPSLSLSPVTPLIPDPFERPPLRGTDSAKWAEDRAIAEKGFYLHPSPRTARRDGQPPRLLPLFPVTSPKASSNSYPATCN
ncbi:unnamed protein product [Musa acuminata subsp. malaccensis]|uniref:(wild Malaysian banana) hypothetical protein n=1 Tax=Musa acuminata subsp. malaccensis TaxID=214687 RepID=A0A804KW24_MUSAM|nr:PREDICTED: VQ motif-containing protein 4-like [Musa acuminata subsp. malaccensis]CAG1853488.1 unnamed protein product [Musa acuminata subsp. malaccensis]